MKAWTELPQCKCGAAHLWNDDGRCHNRTDHPSGFCQECRELLEAEQAKHNQS